MLAVINFILGLFGIGGILKDQINRDQVKGEGRLEQQNVDLNGKVADDQKNIAALKADARLRDYLDSNTAADGLRSKLNDRPSN